MKFMLIYSITPENQLAVLKRQKEDSGPMEGLTILGGWDSVSTGRGFRLIETDDLLALKKFNNHWRDLVVVTTEPVIDQEENRKILGV